MSQTIRQRSALRDVKYLGKPPMREPMGRAGRHVVRFLVGTIVVGTFYGLVADEPERKVVTFHGDTITLTKKQLHDLIVAARIAAAREALDAKECRPGDEFKFPPRRKVL